MATRGQSEAYYVVITILQEIVIFCVEKLFLRLHTRYTQSRMGTF